MGFLELLVLFVVSSIVAYLLRPKIEDTSKPGDFRPPEPRLGEPVAVIFGTTKVSPAVTWFGDVQVEKVIKTKSSLFGLIKNDIPLGYEYSAGFMFTLCHGPVDRLINVYIGEQEVVRKAKYTGPGDIGGEVPSSSWPAPTSPTPFPYSFTADPTRINFNLPDLFGGIEEGGGVIGQWDFHWGSNTQGPNDYLAVFWGADIVSNYRRLCYAVLRRVNMGKNPSPEGWWFVLERIPDVLGQTAFADINGDANGAEAIYELMTDVQWGVGLAAAEIDIATFQAAGETLHDEDLGYSGILTRKEKAWSAIKDILTHIDGVLYQDPLTGLIGLKLIRDDYVVAALPLLNASNSSLDEFVRGSWHETANETHVRYTDRDKRFSDDVVSAQNLANIQALDGEIRSQTVRLPGLSNRVAAQTAVERINRASSTPLARARLHVDRTANVFHQGSVMKITFPEDAITELVMRVVRVRYGSLKEGTIEIEAIQDAWDLSGVAYGFPDNTGLDPCGPLSLLLSGYDPSSDPAAVYGPGEATVIEAPYWLAGAARRAYAMVSRITNNEIHWVPWRSEQGLQEVEVPVTEGFHPVGYLEAAIAQTTAATGIQFDVRTAGELADLTSTDAAGLVAGERLCLIGDEIFAWQTVTDQTGGVYRITLAMRGQLDTVPATHSAGSRVYFFVNVDGADGLIDVSSRDYSADTRIDVWPVRVNIEGVTLDITEIDPVGVLIKDRALAPYPPGVVSLNGNEYDAWPASVVGDATLAWVHRSRTGQSDMVSQDDVTAYTQEGTLTVEALIDGSPVREWTGLTGNSVVYTIGERADDDGDLSKSVQFRITPIGAGSEVGVVRTTPSFTMSAS